MEISAFNPIIITPNADETIALFEALGFERRHQKTGINDEDINSVDMKDANGCRVNVARVDHIPKDMTAIAMPESTEQRINMTKNVNILLSLI